MIKWYNIGILLWTYNILGMTEHTHMLLPETICEQILDYLPADSYARAHWSRYNVCSQEFYDLIVQVFLESHFVPDFCIDTIINQYFATFCSKNAAKKHEFQEKIRKALVRYTEPDTREYELFKTSLEEWQHLRKFIKPACEPLVNYDDQQLHEHLVKLKADGLLKKIIQMAQKNYSQALLYRETIKELILQYGERNARIYCKILEFFEPFEYLFAKIAKNIRSRKTQVCIGSCVAFYGLILIIALRVCLLDEAELNKDPLLKAIKPYSIFLFLSVPSLMCCIGTLVNSSIITDIVINRGKSHHDFIRYVHFLMQMSRRLQLAIRQANALAQV